MGLVQKISNLVIFFAMILLCCSSEAVDFLSNRTRVALQGVTCNANQWSQIPNNPHLFIGRNYRNAAAGTCGQLKATDLTLVIGQMNSAGTQINRIADLIDYPARVEGRYDLINAYDADVFYDRIHKEYWAAFECGLKGIPQGSANSCMAPLDLATKKLIMGRSFVAVKGLSNVFDLSKFHLSASVPKFLNDNDRIYLYWTAVKINQSNGEFVLLTTRGTELKYNSVTKRWVSPYGAGIASDHSSTYEVFGQETGDGLGITSDSYDIKKIGNNYFLLGSVGLCGKPNEPVPGCYRPTIRKSSVPMGNKIFNHARVPDSMLPSNFSAYLTFVERQGKTQVMGFVSNSVVAENSIPSGYYIWDLPANSLFFETGDESYSNDPIYSLVNDAFKVVLGRTADLAGLKGWGQHLYNGMSQKAFIQNLLMSKEGQNRFEFQETPLDFVENGFVLLLNRTSVTLNQEANLQMALNIIDQRIDRLQTLISLVVSREFANKHPSIFPLYTSAPRLGVLTPEFAAINEAYNLVLQRLPDEGGANHNNQFLLNGSRLPFQMIPSFFQSAEGVALYHTSNMSNRDFVATVYQNLFGRSPDTNGWNNWTAKLNSGALSRYAFVEAIAQSTEFRLKHPVFFP